MRFGSLRFPSKSLLGLVSAFVGVACTTGLDGKAFDLDASSGSQAISASSASGVGPGGSGGTGGASGGGGSGTGAQAGSGGGGSGGGAPWCTASLGPGVAPLDDLSDCFEDEFTLSEWDPLPPPSPYAVGGLQIDGEVKGHLLMVPLSGETTFGPGLGGFISKEITGNFVIAVHVTPSTNDVGHDGAPHTDLNNAGLLIRTPTSNVGDPENWVKYDIGTLGSAGAATVGTIYGGTIMSQSDVHPEMVGAYRGQLAICRLGDDFHLASRLESESDWTTIVGLFPGGTPNIPDMPDTVQFGPMSSTSTNADLYAQFDYIVVAAARPASTDDCLEFLESLPLP